MKNQNHIFEYQMDYIEVFCGIMHSKNPSEDMPIEKTHLIANNNNKIPVIFYKLSSENSALPFVIQGGGNYTVGEKYFTKRSGLDNFEIIYTEEGHGVVETNGNTYSCTAGTAVLIDCNEYHYMHTVPKNVWKYRHLHFTCKNDMRYFVEQALGFTNANSRIGHKIDLVFNEIKTSGINSYIMITKYMVDILSEMISLLSGNKISNKNQVHMINASKYIQDHLSEPISVAQLAKNEYMSIYHFTRQFNLFFNTTPKDYIIDKRLDLAIALLKNGSSVNEAAALSGFISANNLYRHFKAKYNYEPSKLKPNKDI